MPNKSSGKKISKNSKADAVEKSSIQQKDPKLEPVHDLSIYLERTFNMVISDPRVFYTDIISYAADHSINSIYEISASQPISVSIYSPALGKALSPMKKIDLSMRRDINASSLLSQCTPHLIDSNLPPVPFGQMISLYLSELKDKGYSNNPNEDDSDNNPNGYNSSVSLYLRYSNYRIIIATNVLNEESGQNPGRLASYLIERAEDLYNANTFIIFCESSYPKIPDVFNRRLKVHDYKRDPDVYKIMYPLTDSYSSPDKYNPMPIYNNTITAGEPINDGNMDSSTELVIKGINSFELVISPPQVYFIKKSISKSVRDTIKMWNAIKKPISNWLTVIAFWKVIICDIAELSMVI